MTTLSICIPTYNFGAFIGQTLDSILPQVTPEVEIIVFDGGSRDETENEVRRRQAACQQLSYIRQNFRGGIDRDIEAAVNLAKGKYCWLFSADDLMHPHAVTVILDVLSSDYDFYICEHKLCDMQMRPIVTHPPFNGVAALTLFNFNVPEQRNRYFSSARTSEAFFSYLAGPIFRKSIWNSVVIPDSFYGTCWIVAGRLLSALKGAVRIQYLGQVLILKREGNDSFSDRSPLKYCRMAIEGFQHISNHIFGRTSFEAFHIRRVWRRDLSLKGILYSKWWVYQNQSLEDMELLKFLTKIHYADSCVTNKFKIAVFTLLGRRMLELSYRIYKIAKKIKRKVRCP